MTERGGESIRPRASGGPLAVTCVLIGEGGAVHVVATPADDASGATGREMPDLLRLAATLESAAAALRGDVAGPTTAPHAKPAMSSTHSAATSHDRIRVGQLEIHPGTRLVLRSGDPVPLSRIEFDLFLALVRRAGEPATRLELVREVWGFGAAVTSRSVDTQIYNLRHKLEENPSNPRHLLTVSGVGYRVAP